MRTKEYFITETFKKYMGVIKMKRKEIVRHLEDLKGYCSYTKGFEYNKDIEALEAAIQAVKIYNKRKYELLEGAMIVVFTIIFSSIFTHLIKLVY